MTEPSDAAKTLLAALREIAQRSPEAIKAWDERKYRRPKGTRLRGRFAPKTGGAESGSRPNPLDMTKPSVSLSAQ